MLASKLPDIGTNIFTVMSGLAAEHGALNLSQGFPDFQVDETLIDRIHHYMKLGHNQYAPMPGVPALRTQISSVVQSTFDRKTNPESEVTIYAGATGGLFSTFTALIHPGDEVILFDPVYDSYDPAIRLSGGIPKYIRLQSPHFAIPWEEVEKQISSKTRMIVVNSPHNPTGAVLSQDDLQELSRLSTKYDLYVVSDEVYERIIFDNKIHNSVLGIPALAERSVALFSFGKTFHATGWKIGYSVASEKITREIRKIHQFVNFAVNTPIQWAIADYLMTPSNYQALGKFYEEKRNRFAEGLKDSAFDVLPCSGTYFQLLNYTGRKNETGMELAHRFILEHGIASIPVSAFYHDQYDEGLLRFCFAKKEGTIDQALKILNGIPR